MSDLDDLANAVQGKAARAPSPTYVAGIARVWMIQHTEPELATLLASGHVSGEALVWKEGAPRWIPITNVVPGPGRYLPSMAGASPTPVVVNVHNTNVVGAYMAPVPVRGPTNGWGTAAMVLGILSLVLFCLPPLSIPLSLGGIVLGIIGLGAASTKKLPGGSSVAGIVLCGIGLLIGIAIAVGMVVAPHPR